MKRQQIGLAKARRQFFESAANKVRAEKASRQRKRIELEQQIGKRTNVFGQVLEDKERMYMETITSSAMRQEENEGRANSIDSQ